MLPSRRAPPPPLAPAPFSHPSLNSRPPFPHTQRGEDLPRAGRGQFSHFLEDLKAAVDAKQVPVRYYERGEKRKKRHLRGRSRSRFPHPPKNSLLTVSLLFSRTTPPPSLTKVRPIEFLFGPGSFVLSCDGLWAEFGVFDGGTLTLAANWRAAHCGPDAPPVFGFDTFSGLPEAWEQGAGGDTFDAGAFDLAGKLPAVPANARLVRGLFSDTLPPFLMELRGGADHADLVGAKAAAAAAAATSPSTSSVTGRKGGGKGGGGGGGADAASHVNPGGLGAAGHAPGRAASYLHIDCDLYAGARDALALLSPLIRPGTVLVFDDLINYAAYRDHEAKALWEWLASTGLHVRVVGVKGPLPGAAGAGGSAMELEPSTRHPHHQQSVAFLVV